MQETSQELNTKVLAQFLTSQLHMLNQLLANQSSLIMQGVETQRVLLLSET